MLSSACLVGDCLGGEGVFAQVYGSEARHVAEVDVLQAADAVSFGSQVLQLVQLLQTTRQLGQTGGGQRQPTEAGHVFDGVREAVVFQVIQGEVDPADKGEHARPGHPQNTLTPKS